MKVCMGKLIMLITELLLFRQRLCKRHFNPKALSPPQSQAMLFMLEDLVPSIHPYFTSSLWIYWFHEGFMMEILLLFLSHFPWHLFCITSRDYMVGLGPERADDAGLLRPGRAHCRLAPAGCSTQAMCLAGEAGDSLCLCEHFVPDWNVSDISSHILYSCQTSSKLS